MKPSPPVTEEPHDDRFDERLWPANSVLALLAVSLAGLIVAYGDFNTHEIAASAERLAASAWFQLGALCLIVLILLLNAGRSASRARIRRLQFSACVGLLLHIGMLVGLHHSDFFFESPLAKKEKTKRRPFEIVSLPSDGRRLTQLLVEQGMDRVVGTDNFSEATAIERMSQEDADAVLETALAQPMAEPETQPREIEPAEIPRADASAARPGQLSAAQLNRELAPGPSPAAEAIAEPVAASQPQIGPQVDGEIAANRRSTEVNLDGGSALGYSPEAPEPNIPLLGPETARRPMGEPAAANTAIAQSPARLPAAASGLAAQAIVESPVITTTPGGSAGPEITGPTNVQVRRNLGGISAPGRGTDGMAAESGLSRPGHSVVPGGPSGIARRVEPSGSRGIRSVRPGGSAPIRRSPILVDGGAEGVAGIAENEPGVGSLAGSSGSGGQPDIEASAQAGASRRQVGGLPGQGVAGGTAGDFGTGLGGGATLPGTGGVGSPGTGSGFARIGNGPARAGLAASSDSPGSGMGRGGFGKSNTIGLPGYVDGEEEGPVPGSLAGSPRGGGSGGELPLPGPSGTGRGTRGSRPMAALPGQLAGPVEPGIGGAGTSVASTIVGVPSPRARQQSENKTGGEGRFILDKATAGVAIDGRANPAPAYRQRGRAGRGRIAEGLGGNAESERAVELGLQFLARHQATDGHWGLHDFGAGRAGYEDAGEGTMEADTAGTGLALLAFLGAGYSHYDEPHRKVVDAGIQYLIRNQKLNGDLFSGGSPNVWFYSHGIAAIALCEAYGMTRDEKLREPAQKAIDFITMSQHPTLGGWRYSPQASSDTSVSGWQMMALKSGELAGLRVAPKVYTGVSKWLDSAQAPSDPSKYSYRPTSQYAHQREPSRAMTAEALLMRLYLGWDRSTPSLVQGADYLQQNLPQFGRPDAPLRDAYYWYYATQVMFQMQGGHWQAWNGQLRSLLVDSQVQAGPFAGSWAPKGAVPDRWGDAGGRLYVTAMHLLMLEVYYRHLPLYQTLTENPSGR